MTVSAPAQTRRCLHAAYSGDMTTVRRGRAAILGAVFAVAAALTLVLPTGGRAAGPDPAPKIQITTFSCTTNASGYCTVGHGLGELPDAVLVTLGSPSGGAPNLPYQLAVTDKTASSFTVRALTTVGTVFVGNVNFNAVLGGPNSGLPTTPPVSTSPPASGVLFADECNGASGAPLDATHWGYDNGGNWDNGQTLQSYTNRPVNSHQDGAGNCVIRAQKETWADWDNITRQYTSARLNTRGHFDLGPGMYVELRAKVPIQQGTWPSLWSFSNDGQTWPPEWDGFEYAWAGDGGPGYLHTNLHYGNGAETGQANWTYANAPVVANAESTFHTYGTWLADDHADWYLDGNKIRTVTFTHAQLWQRQHAIILNVALGYLGGTPAGSFEHADLVWDYLRVTNQPPA